MADLSLGTIFTANVAEFLANVKKMRSELKRLSALMGKGADAAGKKTQRLSAFHKDLRNTIKDTSKVNDSFAESLRRSMKGVGQSEAAKKGVLKTYKRLRDAVNGHARAMNEAGRDGVKYAKSINYASLYSAEATGKIKATANGFQGLTASVRKAARPQVFRALRDRIRDVGKSNETYTKSLLDSVRATNRTKSAMKGVIGDYDRLNKAVNAQAKIMTAAGKDGVGYAKNVNYAAKYQDLLAGKIKLTNKGFEEIGPTVNKAGRKLRKLSGVNKEIFDRISDTGRANKTYTKSLFKQLALTDKTVAGKKDMVKTFDQVRRSINAQAKSMSANNREGASFAKNVNYQALTNSVLAGKLKATSKGFEVIRKSMKGANKEAKPEIFRAMRDRIRELGPTNKTYSRSLLDAAKATNRTSSAVKGAIKRFDKLSTAVDLETQYRKRSGKEWRNWSKNVDYASLHTGLLDKKIRLTSRGIEGLGGAAKRTGFIGKQIAQIGDAMGTIKGAFRVTAAYGLASTAIYTVVNALRAGVAEIINFDQALKNLEAITGATDAEIRVMGETIKHVARTTKFSASEVSDAMVLLGQAGFDAGESLDTIQAVSDLATGTLSNMETTSDLLTTSIRAFALEASQAGQISDVMANAINKSKLTVDKLRIAFNYVGPAAHATGTSIEEVAASMMVLANSGLRASTIGTGLRQVFARLTAPSDRLRAAFESHNISLEDLDIRMHGFSGVLENIADVFIDMKTGATDSRKAFELFGLRGANAILALVRGIRSGEYREAIDSVYEVGTASEMASIQLEGLGLQIKQLSDKLKTFAIEIGGTGFTSVFKVIILTLRKFVDLLTVGVKKIVGDTIVSFISFTAVTYGLIMALGALTAGIKYLIIKLKVLTVAMIKNPTVLLIVAIGALLTSIRAWSNATKKNIELHEEESIKLQKKAKVLRSYRKRLEEAQIAVGRNSKNQFKYNRLIERLIRDFPELTDELNAAKDNFVDLDGTLAKIIERMDKADIVEQMSAINEQLLLIEKTRLLSGLINYYKEFGKELLAIVKGTEHTTTASKEFFEELENTNSLFKRLILTAEEYGKNTEATQTDQAKKQEMFNKLVGVLVDRYKDTELTLGEISEKIQEITSEAKFLGEEGEDTASKIQKAIIDTEKISIDKGTSVYSLIMLILSGIVEARTEMTDMKDPIASLSMVDSVFKRIHASATAFQKVRLVEKFTQMEKALTAYREAASKKEGGIQEDVAIGEAAIRVKFHKEFMEIVRKEGDAKWKQKENEIVMLKEIRGLYNVTYKEELKAVKDSAKKQLENTKLTAKQRLHIKDWEAAKLKFIEKGTGADTIRIRKAIEERIEELEKEAVYERTAFEYEQEITNARAIADQRIHEIEMASIREGNLSELARDKIAGIEVDLAQRIYDIRVDLYEKTKKLYDKDSEERVSTKDEVIASEKSLNDAIKNQVEGRVDLTNEYYQERLKTIHDEYREAKLLEEEYLIFLKEAKARGLLTYQEYEERKALLTGNYWTRFQAGVKAANKEIQTLGEMAFRIGTEISRVFSEGFVDAFSEFINSTEEAGKAFEKFAIDMLDWIGKMIMQLLVMRAVQAGLGFLGGGTPAPETTAGGGGLPGTAAPINQPMSGGGQWLHSGGVVGREPFPVRITNPNVFDNAARLHSGNLKPDEIPAILQKGETVFTEGQMELLKSGMGGTEINVPVNIEYDSPTLANKLRNNIEEVVIKTLREEMR